MATVTALAAGLEKELGNSMTYKAVSTRIMLRTGVNIMSPKPQQDADAAIVDKVRTAITDMGYRL